MITKFSFNENSENKTFSTNTYINKTAQTQGKLLVKDKSILLHYNCRLYNNPIFYHYVRTIQTTFFKVVQIPKVFLYKLELYASYTLLSGQLYTNRAPSIDVNPASL